MSAWTPLRPGLCPAFFFIEFKFINENIFNVLLEIAGPGQANQS